MLIDLRSAGGAPSITSDVVSEIGQRLNAKTKTLRMQLAIVPNGAWDKAPANIVPAPPQTGFQHPKCYARQTNDCSSKITR